MLSTLTNLSSLRTLTSPSSRNLSVDLPLTVDVNDQLSVYGGVSGATSQAGSRSLDEFADLRLYRRIPGRHLSAERRNVSDHHRSIRRDAIDLGRARWPRPPITPSSKADYALNADETRGLLAGAQYTRVFVDTPFARVSPDVMGYVGGYYQWDNNWKLTGRLGVQSFGGAQLLNLTPFPAFTQPICGSTSTAWTMTTIGCSASPRRSPGHRSRRTSSRCGRRFTRSRISLASGQVADTRAAHTGCESRTTAPRSSLPISGLQAPQLVPAFRRRPTSSTLAAPFWISADI